ncbi:MAG: hypothetical protein M3315_03100, partial [Actinomycetota bacterium]|nr:hypothetical protein [Actinomycetota bacterium]
MTLILLSPLSKQHFALWKLAPAKGYLQSRWCQAYRRRNVIERCVNKLKQWRSHATRSEGEYILA